MKKAKKRNERHLIVSKTNRLGNKLRHCHSNINFMNIFITNPGNINEKFETYLNNINYDIDALRALRKFFKKR